MYYGLLAQGIAFDTQGAGIDALCNFENLTGHDSLLGGAGDDVIRGRGGNDRPGGGVGNDQLVGGSGADVFQFDATGWGYDQIFDFAPGTDKINLAGAAANFNQLTFYAIGGSTAVTLGGDRIDVYGVVLTQADFLFA